MIGEAVLEDSYSVCFTILIYIKVNGLSKTSSRRFRFSNSSCKAANLSRKPPGSLVSLWMTSNKTLSFERPLAVSQAAKYTESQDEHILASSDIIT